MYLFSTEQEAFMTASISRIRAAFVAVLIGLTVSACGYNSIPTYEEQAKAKWADVQNNYQRRADLIPNLVATVQGYAKQEKDVLTAVVEARSEATQVKVDASQLTDPAKMKQFEDAQNQLSGALGRLLRSSRAPRIGSQLRGATTSKRCGSTTPSSRRSPACSGLRPSTAPTSQWRSSLRTTMRRRRRK
jgi:hypothetical protein